MNPTTTSHRKGITLITGGTGKIGGRVAAKLAALGVPHRAVSRSSGPAFDWHEPAGWDEALKDVSTVYISIAPDLAIPGTQPIIRAFVERAVAAGVTHLVLLSGRGEEEAQACEEIVRNAGVDWTIVRSGWFMQNFSEGEFADMVRQGAITLPARDIPEPFIDVNDIADVVVAALSEPGHAGELYEVTGPRLLTFTDVAAEIAVATGRDIAFVPVPKDAFAEAITASGAPGEVAWLLNYLFETVLDGRNAYLADGVQRALGREPADFRDFVARIAERDTWDAAGEEAAA